MRLEIKDPAGNLVHSMTLSDGEYTLSITRDEPHHVTVAAAGLGRTSKVPLAAERPSWRELIRPGLILVILMTFESVFMQTNSIETWDGVVNLFRAFSVLAAGTAILTLASRAVSGHFHVRPIVRAVLLSLIGVTLIEYDFFDLRWLLPKVFTYVQIYQLFGFALGSWFVLYLSQFILAGVRRPIRKTVVVSGLVLIFCSIWIGYMPWSSSFRYLDQLPPPPRASLIESREIPVDAFIDRVMATE